MPLKLYFNAGGRVKLLLGLAKGRKADRRDVEKKRDWERQKARLMGRACRRSAGAKAGRRYEPKRAFISANTLKHRFRQAAGIGVIARAVIAGDQRKAAVFMAHLIGGGVAEGASFASPPPAH